MSTQLKDFVGIFSNIVRPNRFYVIIEPPRFQDNTPMIQTSLDSSDMKFFIQSAVIPDRTVESIDIKYFGMTYKIPGNEILSELQITVINDSGWKLRDFFEDWLNLINDRSNSRKGIVRELFNGASVTIQQLGNLGNVITEYTFYNIFPKTVSEIELNYETTDTHQTFTVSFDYSYHIQTITEN